MKPEILYLSDNLIHAETVAQWIYREFFIGIREGVPYERILESARDCHSSRLPVRLIAMTDGKCAGTAALVENDFEGKEYTPWLAALYVDKPYRNKKIGMQLVERIKEIAKNLNYRELFLRTEFAGNYYRKLGWQFIESSSKDNFGLMPDIFKISL